MSDNANTPLVAAIYGGHYRAVEFLLQCGANPDTLSKCEKFSCIFIAIQLRHSNIVKLLIDHGANIEFEIGRRETITPLTYATIRENFESVKFLVEAGANLFSMSHISMSGGLYPIHHASGNEYDDIAVYLLRKMEEKWIPDEDGELWSSIWFNILLKNRHWYCSGSYFEPVCSRRVLREVLESVFAEKIKIFNFDDLLVRFSEENDLEMLRFIRDRFCELKVPRSVIESFNEEIKIQTKRLKSADLSKQMES